METIVKKVSFDLLHQDLWSAMLIWREADKHRDAVVQKAELEEIEIYDRQLAALLNDLRAEIDKVRKEKCKKV